MFVWLTYLFTAEHLRDKVSRMWRLALITLLFICPANAQTDNDIIRPSAKPRFQVVDGDTVKFGPQLVRLSTAGCEAGAGLLAVESAGFWPAKRLPSAVT